MSQGAPSPPQGPQNPFHPGQTLFFIGDHTSPDEAGYVGIVAGVLSRFHPSLKLRLISAGSDRQTAAGLNSRAMLDIFISSRPDWLVAGLGHADALREPAASELQRQYQERAAQSDDAVEATFGPEYRAHIFRDEPRSDVGPEPRPHLHRLEPFKSNLSGALAELNDAGVRAIVLTLPVLGNHFDHPLNAILHAYSKAMREVAREQHAPVVDVERAFRDMLGRAATYNQKVVLTGADGKLNIQGQTLIARTFLAAFGLLPEPGYRPRE